MQAEEKAKIEKEEKAKTDAEEQIKKESERKKETQTLNSQSNNRQTTSNTTTTQKNNSNNSNGKTVYRTPHGKRYHYDPDCGGKNSYQITLDKAKSEGSTPC